MKNWHRLFGLVLTDFFTDTGYTVEVEKDLSLQQQFLDVIVVEQGEHARLVEVPDGLDNLTRHNLITYKSLHEPLNGWALDELIGHYVNYRKQVGSPSGRLLPAKEFQLYAVCTRQPRKLLRKIPLQILQKGVYEVQWGSRKIRLLVLSQMPLAERNAMWQLFSGLKNQVQYGSEHYHWRHADHSTVTNQLYAIVQGEESNMSYTYEDFYREYSDDIMKSLLHAVPPEQLLKNIPPEQLLKNIPPEQRLKDIPPDERLKGLSLEEIEAYLKKLREHHETN